VSAAQLCWSDVRAPIDQPAGVDALKMHTVWVRIPLGALKLARMADGSRRPCVRLFCGKLHAGDACSPAMPVTAVTTGGLSVAGVTLPVCIAPRYDGKRWVSSAAVSASARSACQPESLGRPCASGAPIRRGRRPHGRTALVAATTRRCRNRAPTMRTSSACTSVTAAFLSAVALRKGCGSCASYAAMPGLD
jgi:hypothetical protein